MIKYSQDYLSTSPVHDSRVDNRKGTEWPWVGSTYSVNMLAERLIHAKQDGTGLHHATQTNM